MRLPLACLALLLTACPSSPTTPDPKTGAAKADGKALESKAVMLTPKPKEVGSEVAPAATPKDEGPVATVSEDVKFPLAQMLGKKPGEVEPKLG